MPYRFIVAIVLFLSISKVSHAYHNYRPQYHHRYSKTFMQVRNNFYRSMVERFYESENRRIEQEDRRAAEIAEHNRQEAIRKQTAQKDLTDAYQNFGTLTLHTVETSERFIHIATAAVLKYPEFSEISRNYFNNETRAAYKMVYAIVVYISSNSQTAKQYLTQLGFTEQELASMYVDRRSGGGGNPFACYAGPSGPSQSQPTRISLSQILARHIQF